MARKDYGMYLVIGLQGRGKSKNTFQKAFFWKKKNPDGILISNMPYDFVDITFSSKKDFYKILDYFRQYFKDTNEEVFLYENIFPPIYLIADEAHEYFFARDFKTLEKNSVMLMTQCRKRRVKMEFITQDRGQIDVFIKRLCPDITAYEKAALGLQRETQYYMIDPEANVIDLGSEDGFIRGNAELFSSSIIWWDWLQLIFNPVLIKFFNQRWITNYIVGHNDLLNFTYNEFFNLIVGKHDLIKKGLIEKALSPTGLKRLKKSLNFKKNSDESDSKLDSSSINQPFD